MLNRDDIVVQCLQAIIDYGFNKMIITHGGALVMEGIVDYTNDIDITVSESDFNKLAMSHSVQVNGDCRIISVTKTMDVHAGDVSRNEGLIKELGCIYYHSPETCLENYKSLNRSKDIVKIEAIKFYLAVVKLHHSACVISSLLEERKRLMLDCHSNQPAQ